MVDCEVANATRHMWCFVSSMHAMMLSVMDVSSFSHSPWLGSLLLQTTGYCRHTNKQVKCSTN